MAPKPQRPATRRDFEIAIICALTLEADAVHALFDHYWDDDGFSYGKAVGDPNAYSPGAIGYHNVVLAHMPGMGKANAAAVAVSCRASFPNIKLALVVGVCGAVPFTPDGQEILLGDIIISDGLVQYDLGRMLPEQFVRKDTLLDSLGRPNLEIRALLAKLKGVRTRRMIQGKITEHMNVLRNDPDLKVEYPGTSYDKLFKTTYCHVRDGLSCDECGCNGELVPRIRLEQSLLEPAVHFGLLASGDTVMKSGEHRDSIAKRESVVGFEMEGSGVWDSFPCVVIKSACDYADSHKTKAWQRYAAATAAACMKAFLNYWVPSLASDVRQSDNMAIPEVSQVDEKLVLLKRLWTSKSKYEDQKDRNPKRVTGTCEWFTNHTRFRSWQEKKGSALLWVSADPGCGKSVLAKYLVDEIVPSASTRTTCYFFFKDDFEDQKKLAGALCCILFQLFRQKPTLLSNDILDEFDKGGDDIFTTFQDLWPILIRATNREDVGEIIFILDALDECEQKGQTELVKALSKFYGSGSNKSTLKFLVTSRPYAQIQREFKTLEDDQPTIHLSGENEEEVKSISLEIDIVIQARLNQLSSMLNLSDEDEQICRKELTAIEHRTYLWVYLVFDFIEQDTTIFTKGDLRENIRNLPKTVEAAYEKILCKSRHVDRAKKLLHLVVAAGRPLSLQEMAVALAITHSHRFHSDLEKELLSPNILLNNIREACGLFVIIKDSRIYLLHQTAKEFLLRPNSLESVESTKFFLEWQYSLHPMESHRILSEICIWYLLLADFEQPIGSVGFDGKEDQYTFLEYSAKNWATHLRHAYTKTNDTTVSLALKLCDTDSLTWANWFRIYWASKRSEFPQRFNALIMTSYFGLKQVVYLLLQTKNDNLSSQDATYGRSALSWASENGHDSTVRLLLNRVPKYKVVLRDWLSKTSTIVNARDVVGRTPLWYAAANGQTEIVEMLIDKGAHIDCEDNYGQTPLEWAVYNRHESTVKLLLQKGAKHKSNAKLLVSKDKHGRTLLAQAVAKGHEAVVHILLDRGADIEAKDIYGSTPLALAAEEGNEAVVQILLDRGADVESKNDYSSTPLALAAEEGNEAAVQILLDRGANVESKDGNSSTPLALAAKEGNEAVVQILLDRGADIEAKDDSGNAPLALAAKEGNEAVVQILLDRGADIEAKNDSVNTPLALAAEEWNEAVVQILLDRGADIEAKDGYGNTPLSLAAKEGHESVVQILLDRGADIEAKNDFLNTPLARAAEQGHESVVQILLDKGADIEVKNGVGSAPVSVRKSIWKR